MIKLLLVLTILYNMLLPFDRINTGQEQYYGKISSFDNNKIIYNSECSGSYMQIDWQVDYYIEFNDMCHHPEWTMSTNPVESSTSCEKQIVFVIKFKGIDPIAYASSLSCKNNIVTFNFYNNRGLKAYYTSGIESISKRQECKNDIPTDYQIP